MSSSAAPTATSENFVKPIVYVKVDHPRGCSQRHHLVMSVPDDTSFERVLELALLEPDGALPADLVAAVSNARESLSCKAGENRQDKPGITMMLTAPIRDAIELGCRYINFEVKVGGSAAETGSTFTSPSGSTCWGLRQDPGSRATGKLEFFPESKTSSRGDGQMREQLKQYMMANCIGWRTPLKADDSGTCFLDYLSSLLWYITDHWSKFKERSIYLPHAFTDYRGKSRHKETRNQAPKLTTSKLLAHAIKVLT